MSRSDDIWILGIHMTKFGKHFDKDIVDLASEQGGNVAGSEAGREIERPTPHPRGARGPIAAHTVNTAAGRRRRRA